MSGLSVQKGILAMGTMRSWDVIIVGGGIAGCALATTLARAGLAVAVLERDPEPVDRVRGEFMAPWGVIELKRLGLLDTLMNAGGVFSVRNIPYDENQPGEQAIPFTVRYADLVPDVAGAFCMGHPAMCRVLADKAESAGATILRGIGDIAVELEPHRGSHLPTMASASNGRRDWLSERTAAIRVSVISSA